MYKKNSNINLFIKNINNRIKSIPFNNKKGEHGQMKYLPPYFKEWKNSIYSYDKNLIKNIPAQNIKINKLIVSYFNLYFKNNMFLGNKYIPKKKIRTFLRRIFISKAEIRHTSSKALITIYTINIGKDRLYKRYFKYAEYILTKVKSLRKNKKSIFKFIKDNVKFKYLSLKKTNNISNFDNIFMSKIKYLDNSIRWYNLYIKLYLTQIIKYIYYENLMLLRNYQYLYLLNKYKFSYFFYLSKLSHKISNILNKKVEFNLINLKSVAYNSDIFTTALALKLRKRKFNLIKSMMTILNKGKIPKTNKMIETNNILNENITRNIFINKHKDTNITSIIKNNHTFVKLLENIYYKDKYNFYVNKTNNIRNELEIKLNENYYSQNLNKLIEYKDNNTFIHNIIFDNINYKNIGGIRLEIKGRLTKRYRADRALYKLFWKGGLKNIDSSFKGLSSVLIRGHMKSNVNYSICNSKRRIGAFAVKGWISGK